MFKSWRLENMKSYGGKHDVPLSMINIVAGANSSGKSTLIQSVLLLKQTLQYGNAEKTVLLNGPLLRLGSFDEVLTACISDSLVTSPELLGIGFTLAFSSDAMRRFKQQWLRSSTLLHWNSSRNDYISEISCHVDWSKQRVFHDPAARQRRLLPDIDAIDLKVTNSTKDGPNIQNLSFTARTRDASAFTYAQFEAILDSTSKVELSQNRPEAVIEGGYIDRFLPQFVGVRYNAMAKNAGEIASYMFDRGGLIGSYSTHGSMELPDTVAEYIANWLSSHGRATVAPELVTVDNARNLISQALPDMNLFIINKPSPDLERDVIAAKELVRTRLLESLPAEQDYDFALPTNIRTAVQAIQEQFREGVRYLGPLRDPPRPVYPLEALPSSTDVGYRGEHTAAVLDLNRDTRVSYAVPPGDQLENDYVSKAQVKHAPLHEAVKSWLQYLGVAELVETHDESVFGTRLQVSTGSGVGMHDLTNVGVGVSQVLPIIVMALLAKPESLLIFEQPELHLHPRVQARLADFFLSLAKVNKQVLAETHSEYLVDRFRLRVALGEDERVNDLLAIMFSERKSSQTTLRRIELTKYGSLVEWPDDFFDQSQGDVSRILKAAAKKRKLGQERL